MNVFHTAVRKNQDVIPVQGLRTVLNPAVSFHDLNFLVSTWRWCLSCVAALSTIGRSTVPRRQILTSRFLKRHCYLPLHFWCFLVTHAGSCRKGTRSRQGSYDITDGRNLISVVAASIAKFGEAEIETGTETAETVLERGC